VPEDIKVKKCKNAIMAAAEIVSQEACEGGTMVTLPVGDGLLIWVPEEAIKEIGYSPHSPATPEEIEKAIKSCMESRWAENWARAFVGETAPLEVLNTVKKAICERMFKKFSPTFSV